MAGTLVANTINTDTGLFSTQNAYQGIAKAWISYNGVSKTINSSFNVSSVTYNSTGNYTLNFATAMSNANYAVAFGTIGITSNTDARQTTVINGTVSSSPTLKSTTQLNILTGVTSSAIIQDAYEVDVIVCGA